MESSKTINLKFIGMDSWQRPVYQEENGTLWKDTNPRKEMQPELCTAVDNELNGEPDIPMRYVENYKDMIPVFDPERVVW